MEINIASIHPEQQSTLNRIVSDRTTRPPRTQMPPLTSLIVSSPRLKRHKPRDPQPPSLVLGPLPYPSDDLSIVSLGSQPARQMQHSVTLSSERDIDSLFTNERRWRNDECTSEIDQISVGNGGFGNVERRKALLKAACHIHLESFSVELAIEIGAAASECASGSVHDDPVVQDSHHAYCRMRQASYYCQNSVETRVRKAK